MKVLIAGGSGFIGRNLIEKLLIHTDYKIFNIDKNGYASDEIIIDNNLKDRYKFINYDLSDSSKIQEIIFQINPDLIINLAADTHVDRSIDDPDVFVENNISATLNLLESARKLYLKMDKDRKNKFIFYHAGTDEIYGSAKENSFFNEQSKINPRSPYSASKASTDFLVKSWFHTYKLPILIGNCSNNFGPGQFPEKLIPLVIFKIINNFKIPIYGDGEFIRDWIYVHDHVEAILKIIELGKYGESYCIGANNLISNNAIVKLICEILDKKLNKKSSSKNLIYYVRDRPGNDKRYALDTKKIKKEINWEPKYSFESSLRITVDWYLNNQIWVEKQLGKSDYNCERLGLKNYFK